MIDIKLIRETPQILDQSLEKRGAEPCALHLQKLDEQIRLNQTKLQELQTRRNEVAKNIGSLKSKGENVDHLFKEAEDIKAAIPSCEEETNTLRQQLEELMVSIPNILQDSVPYGKDETDNVEIRKFGNPKSFSFKPLEHNELGENLGMMDFEQTAKISGARFTTLLGPLARLERALKNFMLDCHTKSFGYQEVVPPFLVREQAAFGVGQLPKFKDDLFKTVDDYYLISTSEVSLTNLVADKIVPEEQLPLRFTAYSHCFRSEAGSTGKDTKGMFRQHQFSKVEMVSITTEKDSYAEHERMTKAAENILQLLEIPYRVMLLCSGDTGFQSSKTYDIEVWLPGQTRYREISSCSNCTDFQSRRLKARYKNVNDHKNYLLHTLNGSGLAIGRTIIAIMENYQNEDCSITVPKILIPYMDGLEIIKNS